MSEEKKIIPRLGKAAKEFNIATSTIVEFLKEKGFVVENNDNTKLTPELYDLINQKYKSDKDVKEESKKIEIGSGLKTVSSPSDTNKEESLKEIESDKKEIIVKRPTQIEKSETEVVVDKVIQEEPDFKVDKKQGLNVIGKIDLSALNKPKKKVEKIKEIEVETPVLDPEVVPIKEEVITIIETTQEPVEQAIEEPVEVIIEEDIEPITEKEEEIAEPIIEDVEEEVEDEIEEEEEETDEKSKEIEDNTSFYNTEDENSLDKKEPEKMELRAPKIGSGPTVVGKIDLKGLNTLTKPKKKTKEELKREKKEKRDKELEQKKLQFEAKKAEQSSEKSSVSKFIKADNNDKSTVLELSETAVSPKNVWKKKTTNELEEDDDKKGKIKRKRIKTSYNKESDLSTLGEFGDGIKKRKDKSIVLKGAHKTDFTEEEIEKQVKKTLARLAPLGKTKSSKYRKEKREHIQHEIFEAHERSEQEKNILKVTEFITANELANMMNIPVTQIISTCMSIGLAVAINQRLGAETISILADEFGYKIQFVGLDDDEKEEEIDMNPAELVERSPIVTVMGHVDHGKTSLLDYIRKTNVIAGEAGGITQHIGAYEVQLLNNKRITFLDTPGHEAFTAMRARGAKVTDIVIVVIAADDAIMPQTSEAINHAQAAGVPMIFAINKIDKPGADPEKIRNALANMNLLVEEWGGKIQSQDISAKKGINVEVLLEKILIEAEMLDLKANPKALATGTVIESSLDKGRGYVAKILVQNGTLRTGDIIAAGTACGKIRAMYNERNQLIKEAGPSVPVLILGLNSAPQAGDTFKVFKEEREAKNVVNKRIQLVREQGLRSQKHITLDEIGRRIAIGDFKELNIIVKGDVDGSIEALSDSLLRLSTSEVQVNVIHKSVGQVIESDVLLASASNAIIIAFQVRPSGGAKKLAEQEQVDIRTYSIIYDAINELKDAIEGMRAPEIRENIVCNIEVRETFHITKVGTIAGCYVLDGKVQRNTQIRVIRDGIVIYTGKLGSLKRFKDDVKEVSSGYECGLNIVGFNDMKVGDIIEGFEQVEVKR